MMKRLISLTLALVMMISLAACGNKDKIPDNTDNSSVDSSQGSIPEDDKTGTDEGTVDNTENEIIATVGSLNERLAYIIDNARDTEAAEAIPAETSNINGVLDLLQIQEDQTLEYSVAMSMMNVHAYMVAVIKAAENQEEIITKALQDYKDGTIKSFEMYLPDQLEIAKNAIVFAKLGYIGLVMCDKQDEVMANIEKMLSEIDKIVIDESLAKPTQVDMVLSDIKELNDKFLSGEIVEAKWEYFDKFNGSDIGSGLYIYEYPIVGGEYSVRVGGSSLETNPEYIHFVKNSDTDNYVDVMKDDIMDIVQ